MPVKSALSGKLHEAMTLQKAGRFAQAEKIYQEILADNPNQPDAVHLLGLVRMEQERDGEAVELMERALELFPQAPHFHHNIAGIYRRMGRLEEAESEFRQALELKPDYGEAYQGLAEMVKFQVGDPLFEKIDVQLERDDLSDELKSYFHFAAGKLFDDIKDYKRAFRHFREGNRLAHREFNSTEFRDLVKDLLYNYSKAHTIRYRGAGLPSEVPVFIVGMPRSGTTLIEQILASHSKVFGAGELNDMKRMAHGTTRLSQFNVPFPTAVPGVARDKYAQLSQAYLDRVQGMVNEKGITRIIDKHPLNFQFVGLILDMFPNARIIHTVRNPLDTCLSCFFQNFTKGQDYSFNLEALSHFYNDYRRLMEHWELIYPNSLYTVRYEDVIEDQEAETRKLLDFMGLEFEEQCIDFHKTDRKVSTASFLQVRKPIYKTSQRRWLNYREELGQLANIIGVKIESPVTITAGGAGSKTTILS